jgi:hypothetical protein
MNKIFLQAISGIGIVIFGLILSCTFLLEKPLERTALQFLQKETISQVNQRIDQLLGIGSEDQNIIQKIFLQQYEKEVPLLKDEIDIITKMVTVKLSENESNTESDIEFISFIFTVDLKSKLWEYELVKLAIDNIGKEVKSYYKSTWSSLLQDIRIFSIINLLSFFLIFAVSLIFKEIPIYLSSCAWVLLVSTFVSISIYTYGQNWFYTIIYNKYYGTSYFTILGGLFAYLLFRFTLDFSVLNQNLTSQSTRTK